MADDTKKYSINPLAAGMMAFGDAVSGIYGQRGNTYATYLDAQTKRQALEVENQKYQAAQAQQQFENAAKNNTYKLELAKYGLDAQKATQDQFLKAANIGISPVSTQNIQDQLRQGSIANQPIGPRPNNPMGDAAINSPMMAGKRALRDFMSKTQTDPSGKRWFDNPNSSKMIDTGMRDDSGNPIMAPRVQATFDAQRETKQNKRITDMGNDLDWNKNVRSAYGVTAQGYHRAERLEGLVTRYKDMNLDSRETEELAIGLNSLLQGSNQSAQEQVKSLVPKSALGNVQKMREWLVNEPQGLKQQKFVERMINDVRREKDVMQMQLMRDARQKLSKWSDIEKTNPVEWEDTLRSWGIEPDAYKAWKKSGYKNDLNFSDLKGDKSSEQNVSPQQIKQSAPKGASHYSPSTGKYYDSKGKEL